MIVEDLSQHYTAAGHAGVQALNINYSNLYQINIIMFYPESPGECGV